MCIYSWLTCFCMLPTWRQALDTQFGRTCVAVPSSQAHTVQLVCQPTVSKHKIWNIPLLMNTSKGKFHLLWWLNNMPQWPPYDTHKHVCVLCVCVCDPHTCFWLSMHVHDVHVYTVEPVMWKLPVMPNIVWIIWYQKRIMVWFSWISHSQTVISMEFIQQFKINVQLSVMLKGYLSSLVKKIATPLELELMSITNIKDAL